MRRGTPPVSGGCRPAPPARTASAPAPRPPTAGGGCTTRSPRATAAPGGSARSRAAPAAPGRAAPASSRSSGWPMRMICSSLRSAVSRLVSRRNCSSTSGARLCASSMTSTALRPSAWARSRKAFSASTAALTPVAPGGRAAARRRAELVADRLQQLGHREPRVEDVGHRAVRRDLLQEAAADGGLAGADLAGEQHEAATAAHAVEQVRQGLAVALAHEEKARVGSDREGLPGEAEEGRVHGAMLTRRRRAATGAGGAVQPTPRYVLPDARRLGRQRPRRAAARPRAPPSGTASPARRRRPAGAPRPPAGCGAVAPAVRCNGPAASTSRALSSSACRRAGARAAPSAHHIVASTRWPARPSGLSSSRRSSASIRARSSHTPGSSRCWREAAAVEGLAGRRQAQRQQVPAHGLGARSQLQLHAVQRDGSRGRPASPAAATPGAHRRPRAAAPAGWPGHRCCGSSAWRWAS